MTDSADFVIETHLPEETESLGHAIASLLPIGALVALHGELAAGKTCLVRGMAQHFAPDEQVSSPSFTIVNEYGDGPVLYHLDLYRLESIEDIHSLGYQEILEPLDGVCVVEWAERAAPFLPKKRLDILLEHVNETTRRIRIHNVGLLPNDWKKMMRVQ